MTTIGGDILHGTWIAAQQQFLLWAEAPEQRRRKGRQPKVPFHPYHSPNDALRDHLVRLSIAAPDLVEQTHIFWLPSVGTMPVPSPEMEATGAIATPEGTPELRSWQIDGILLPISPALTLLSRLPTAEHDGRGLGADLRSWRVASLLAMSLVAGQQVAPTLQRDGTRLRAAWRPQSDPILGAQIAHLAPTLPPLCRAAIADPADAPHPRALLETTSWHPLWMHLSARLAISRR